MPHDYDVVIIGAGMVGASLACTLAPLGLRIAVVEAVTLKDEQQPSYDDRGITLSPSSRQILQHIGVWQAVQAHVNPIKKIHVSEQGRFGFTHLDPSQTGDNELGYVVVARSLGQALHKKMLSFDNVSFICPAELKHFQQTEMGMCIEVSRSTGNEVLTAGLLVGADGSRSLVRRLADINTNEHDYGQTAIVANVTTEKANQATAYERFTSHGPIALLPIDKNRSVLVFTVDRENAEQYMAMGEAQFIAAVETEFGRRLGKLEQLGQRRCYPIMYIEAVEQYQQQLVLLGNAAHTIHPNAAQGFNLGLRDVAGLAECIFSGVEKGFGVDEISILENYMNLRKTDQQRVMRFSDRIAKSFYNNMPLLVPARNLALLMLDIIPDLKTSFIQQAMGIAGLQPRLVRGELL